MTELLIHLKTAALHLDPKEILQSPVTVLRGVGAAQAQALQNISINNIFELAASRVFDNATKLMAASKEPNDPLNKFGAAPPDMAIQPAGIKVDALTSSGVEILQGVVDPDQLKAALSVETVRELALWQPYIAAKEIFRSVYFPEQVSDFDLEAPADLLPKSGEYPTERVFYTSLVLDEVNDKPDRDLIEEGAISISPLTAADFGFKRLGVGALLTFSQSWYAKGVTLGSLLHSVALAPGESTRIAMMDWSRSESGRQDESLSETEELSNTTQHNRAMSEVTSAVAQEAQQGFSEASSSANSTQSGRSTGRAGMQTEGMIEGAFNAVFGGGNDFGTYSEGTSTSTATSTTHGTAFSSSSGRRDLSASMAQNISDSTQQNASAARNRRASVVREVSQKESQNITTRVVANYNHMHALSIQYYEIVQIYSVEVQLSKVDKCLFIPMKWIDFKQNYELIGKYRRELASAALNRTIRNALLNEFERVRISTQNAISPSQAAAARRIVGSEKFLITLRSIYLPPETMLIGIDLTNLTGGVETVFAVLEDGREIRTARHAQGFNLLTPQPINNIRHVRVKRANAVASPVHAKLRLKYAGSSFALDLRDELDAEKSATFLDMSRELAHPNLLDHLIENTRHYSQAIFRSLDASSLALLLSPFHYKGKPVTQQVDPTPVTYVANFIVLKMHEEPEQDGTRSEWGEWLDDHGISFSKIDQQIIPLPSGGVFAEAVLGRYNSAEKLDKTRFWNWQDSPIPLTAPEISPSQLSTPQATQMPLVGGGFSNPLVNIVSPTNLPDPVGLAAAMQAIQNGNMFRDMSGLSDIVKLAQSGVTATTAGATAAGQQAGTNMKTAADNFAEIAKIAGQVAMSAMGMPSGGIGGGSGNGGTGGKSSGISGEGANLNYARDMDNRATGGPTGMSGVRLPASSEGGGTSEGGSSGGVGPNEQLQLDTQTLGTGGMIARDTNESLFQLAKNDSLGFEAEGASKFERKPVSTPFYKVNYTTEGLPIATKPPLGWQQYFNLVSFNSSTRTLTVTIRPKFIFDPTARPSTLDTPEMNARYDVFEREKRPNACKKSFAAMANAWSGHHRFWLQKEGFEHISATVSVEVEEFGDGTVAGAGHFVEVRFKERARDNVTGAMALEYDSAVIPAIPELNEDAVYIRPRKHLVDALAGLHQPGEGIPSANPYNGDPQYTIMHEIGHLFGLGDEYIDSQRSDYAQGLPTFHTSLAQAELGIAVNHGWNDQSMMARGNDVLDVHGVTFLGALRTLTGMPWGFKRMGS